MSLGWFFLLGWLLMLLVACGLAFRGELMAEPTAKANKDKVL